MLPLPLFIRLAFVAGAVTAMAIYLPRWAQPPELPQRNENAATVAAVVAAGRAFLLWAVAVRYTGRDPLGVGSRPWLWLALVSAYTIAVILWGWLLAGGR